MKLKHLAIFGIVLSLLFGMLFFFVLILGDSDDSRNNGFQLEAGGLPFPEAVLKHRATVEKYCKEYGIEEYINYILAIMTVESGGTAIDVMQSSESLGLPPNTLGTEESIKQGVKYFSELLALAEAKGCDLNTVVQSYNYGGGFMNYVEQNGKKYTYELAVAFAKDKSGGVTVPYSMPLAVAKNGGWRYKYGNQFYGATRF